jgi:hypothetical protein
VHKKEGDRRDHQRAKCGIKLPLRQPNVDGNPIRPMTPPPMENYRFQRLDAVSNTSRSFDFECANDAAAYDLALILAEGHKVEIWTGPRWVARVKPWSEPLTVADAASL